MTAVTGGAAGLVLGAIAAAEATVLAKLAVKGGAYTDEELLVDVATGVVDAVLAIPTARMGGLLLRTVAKGMPIGPLAKLATSASRTKRMVAHGLQNSVEGFLGGVASGTVGALADERTWNNPDVLGNVAAPRGVWAGSGRGNGRRHRAHWAASRKCRCRGPHLDPGRPPDLDAAAKAFDEAQRPGAAAWTSRRPGRPGPPSGTRTRQKHPAASYADFLADLDAGRISARPRRRRDVRARRPRRVGLRAPARRAGGARRRGRARAQRRGVLPGHPLGERPGGHDRQGRQAAGGDAGERADLARCARRASTPRRSSTPGSPTT